MIGFYDLCPFKSGWPGVLLTDTELAIGLDISSDWLRANPEKLQAMGFPEPVAATGARWDAGAAWTWLRAMRAINRRLPGPPTEPIGELIDWSQEIAGDTGEGS